MPVGLPVLPMVEHEVVINRIRFDMKSPCVFGYEIVVDLLQPYLLSSQRYSKLMSTHSLHDVSNGCVNSVSDVSKALTGVDAVMAIVAGSQFTANPLLLFYHQLSIG